MVAHLILVTCHQLEGEDGGTKLGNDAVLAAWLKTFMGATEKPWSVEKRRASAQDPNENEMKLLGWGGPADP